MEENKDELLRCSICGDILEPNDFGNNAEPVNNGICCDVCNFAYVIPARIKLSNKK